MPIHGAARCLYDAYGRRKYLNADERRRFLAAAQLAPPTVRTLCLTMTYLGCRISEALQLRGRDVQASESVISIRCLKKRGDIVVREVPVPPALVQELACIHALDQHNARLWPWGRTTAWRFIKTVMSEAGLSSLSATPRGLRHGFGTRAIMSGVPLNVLQKWLGHADIATTAIYADVVGPEERAIAARMW
jgi:integrase/recombinase XerD